MSCAWSAGLLLAAAAWAAPSAAQLAGAAQPGDTESSIPGASITGSSVTGSSTPEPSLTVELQPASVTIGDRVEALLKLETTGALSAPPRFPVWEEHWGEAEIVGVDPPSDEGNGVWLQRLELALFETGAATLPSVEVEVPGAEGTRTATSDPAAIEVGSVLPPEAEEVAPQPPAPVRALPAGAAFWSAMALLGLACLALAAFAWRSARRIRAALAAMALNPLEAFERALAQLRDEAGVERVYTGLSLELRRYLGRTLGFPAAEGTTTQIQRSLRERQLPQELVAETLGLLREADQIKFARGDADRQRADRRLDDAERLAVGVERWLEPVAEESEAVA